MRVIGMDIHRVFAEVVALLDGVPTRLGRPDMRRDRLEEFARSTLTRDDYVVVEATGNAGRTGEARPLDRHAPEPLRSPRLSRRLASPARRAPVRAAWPDLPP